MLTTRAILCPTDFSDNAMWALDRAVCWAATLGADLHVLHVHTLFQDEGEQAKHFPSLDTYRRKLDELGRRNSGRLSIERPMSLTKHTLRSVSVASAVVEYAESVGAGLIVLGTHGRTGLPRAVLGSVAEQVLRLAPMSVVTVGPERHNAEPANIAKRVMVPVDFSSASKLAVRHAVDLAAASDGHALLVHVVEPLMHPAFYVFGRGSIFEVFPSLRERSNALLEELAQGAKAPVEVLVAEGRAHDQIARICREHECDLVFMSAQGLGNAHKHLLGSVATKVARTAPAPVLTYKP